MKKEEYRQALHETITREGVISGIYNYCDRWCEQCDFTKKCALAIREEFMKENNTDLSEGLKLIFEVTNDMLMAEMKRLGIEFDPDAELPGEYDPGELCCELKQRSFGYGLNIMQWLKNFNPPGAAGGPVSDALDVVGHYSLTIGAKTARAIPYIEPNEFLEDDNIGSAKVALLSIDKSLKAWILLFEAFPCYELKILGWMKELSWLRDSLESVFPNARSFARPGFDE
ncbi:MAG TPA: hypothetical protein VE870_12890 [Bacteroidales bacterium]|nr:hypothetical protein [Bacteroidales bacterium]